MVGFIRLLKSIDVSGGAVQLERLIMLDTLENFFSKIKLTIKNNKHVILLELFKIKEYF